jgi:hypothetical protein
MPPSRSRLLASLFLVAAATIMFEILLTRIFSLTMWFHFAFMAISLAMFGLTVGALLVFLRPERWPDATLARSMGRAALYFALAMAAAVLLHITLYIPSAQADLVPIILTFGVVAVPFVFSGIFICLALTRFPAVVGKLYAADLIGAATGCLAVVVALRWLDGVGAVLACAALAAVASSTLLSGAARAAALSVAAVLGGTSVWSGVHLAQNGLAALEIRYIRGAEQPAIEYERWNSFSRIAVLKPGELGHVAWNMSRAFKGSLEVPIRWLQIDSHAGTQLIGFDGDLAKVEFLRWDLPNFVHHLRSNARVAIVGPGGGRDVLTAKLFGQKRVVAVELNGDIMRVANQRYGEFTGHLDRDPGVTFVNDEARSYLARQKERFDIVELTFIDTFAATAAGAYTLSENPLYTVEGWKVFLERLDDNGLLAVSRAVGNELGRMVALGRAALLGIGAAEPEKHMVMVTNRHYDKKSVHAMGLLLVRKTPFGEEELGHIRALAGQMEFDIDLQPGAARTKLLHALATGRGVEAIAPPAVDYSAPTDDRPFFFYMARPSAWLLMSGGEASPVSAALVVLAGLLFTVIILTLACIALPLVLSRTRLAARDTGLLAFFAAIGTGFMLVEISMMQRLIVFLGHPVYGLSVILFVLLLAGGLGSYLSTRIPDTRLRAAGARVLAVLVAVLVAVGLATLPLIAAFSDGSTPARIAISGALLGAMGLLMGTAFPLGMRLAAASRPGLAPWLWGVNGATSVLASVLAVVISMALGISASFWAGVAVYVLALAAFAFAARVPATAR